MRVSRVVVGAVVATVAVSAAAVAAVDGSSDIDGCYVKSGKSKGQLRVLTSGKCRSNETAVSWSKTGPSGATGAKGESGPKGETGPQGAKGEQGPAGTAQLLAGGRALSEGTLDAYLKISNIDGESTTQGHEGEIPLKSFGFSLRRTINPGASGGGSSAPVIGAIKLSKLVDRASPPLANRVITGNTLPYAKITFVANTSRGPVDFMTLKLAQVYVGAWNQGGDQEPAGFERVELEPAKFLITYRAIDASGGLGGQVRFGFDRVSSVVLTDDSQFGGI